MLRNKQRARACKVGSVVEDRDSSWASVGSAEAVCEDTSFQTTQKGRQE